MSDFIFNDEDFVDFIKTDEDLKLFNRMKELEPELSKPIKECYEAVVEISNIRRKLRGEPPIKFIRINPNADLLN